jgi:hypothetical protein
MEKKHIHISERQRFENTSPGVALNSLEKRVDAFEKAGHQNAKSLHSSLVAVIEDHDGRLRRRMRRKFKNLWIFMGVESLGFFVALFYVLAKSLR